MAMGRLNRPSLMIYGGTIKPGKSCLNSEPLDIVSAFQSYGENVGIFFLTDCEVGRLQICIRAPLFSFTLFYFGGREWAVCH